MRAGLIRNRFSTTTNQTTHTHTGKSTLYILKLSRQGKSLWKHQIVMRNRLSESIRDRKEETERQRDVMMTKERELLNIM